VAIHLSPEDPNLIADFAAGTVRHTQIDTYGDDRAYARVI
jgi:hypothetical protein